MIAETADASAPAAWTALLAAPSRKTVQAALRCLETHRYLGHQYHHHQGEVEARFSELRSTRGIKTELVRLRQIAIQEARKLRRPALRTVSADDSQRLQPILELLPDAPITPAALVPNDYRLTEFAVYGVHRDQNTGELSSYEIAAPPVLITARHCELEGSGERVTVAWQRDGRWKQHVVERSVVMDARRIVALADFGLPVSSHNARDLVAYFFKFDEVNAELVERVDVATRFGWHEVHGEIGYLHGYTHIQQGSEDDHGAHNAAAGGGV